MFRKSSPTRKQFSCSPQATPRHRTSDCLTRGTSRNNVHFCTCEQNGQFLKQKDRLCTLLQLFVILRNIPPVFLASTSAWIVDASALPNVPLSIDFSMNSASPPLTVTLRPFKWFVLGTQPGAGSPVGQGRGPKGNFFLSAWSNPFIVCSCCILISGKSLVKLSKAKLLSFSESASSLLTVD